MKDKITDIDKYIEIKIKGKEYYLDAETILLLLDIYCECNNKKFNLEIIKKEAKQ